MWGVRGREGDVFGEESAHADIRASGTDIIPAQGILLKSRGPRPLSHGRWCMKRIRFMTHRAPTHQTAPLPKQIYTIRYLPGSTWFAGCEERTGAR